MAPKTLNQNLTLWLRGCRTLQAYCESAGVEYESIAPQTFVLSTTQAMQPEGKKGVALMKAKGQLAQEEAERALFQTAFEVIPTPSILPYGAGTQHPLTPPWP